MLTVAGNTGKTTITDLVATTADINGGTLDNVAIGATTASTGVFTQVDSGDIRITSTTISSTSTNANIVLDADGTGEIVMNDNIRLTSKSFTCDSSKRGLMYFEEDATTDKVYVCMLSGGSYTLVQLN